MYQWKEESKSETRKTAGGGEETVTTYTYRREWSGKPIDSSKFKQPGLHENPPMQITDRDVLARDATLGSFRLSEPALRSFNIDTKLDVDPSVAETVRKTTGRPVTIADGQIYLSDNPGSPRIGDYRIGYRIVPSGTGERGGAPERHRARGIPDQGRRRHSPCAYRLAIRRRNVQGGAGPEPGADLDPARGVCRHHVHRLRVFDLICWSRSRTCCRSSAI